MVVLGLLALLPLTALTSLSRGVVRDYRGRPFSNKFELKDGVMKKKSEWSSLICFLQVASGN
jgi:hypothetical protein